jgi:hypothetical protein
MTITNFNKFHKYVFLPDLSNKFLVTSVNSLVKPDSFKIYLKYILSSQRQYNYAAIKALLMLETIYPKRCLMRSKLIIIQYTKTRCHSFIYLELTGREAFGLLTYTSSMPTKLTTTVNAFIKEAKHFVFPTFIKVLQFPSWTRHVNISFQAIAPQYLYTFLFYKTALID